MYYNQSINCNCPPRCGERIFEKFVSTGKELPQCSALSSPNKEAPSSENKSESNKNDIINILFIYYRENFAKVVVYFQSLSYQEINQYPKYTVRHFLLLN